MSTRSRISDAIDLIASDVKHIYPKPIPTGQYVLDVDHNGDTTWKLAPSSPPQYAQLRNAAATNVNSSTNWTLIPMGIIDFQEGAFAVSAGNNGIQCLFDGVVKVVAHISMFGNQTIRTNPIIRLAGAVDIPQNVQGKSGYIRDGTGHEESSSSIPGIKFNVTNGEVITLESKKETTAGGVVTIPVGGSFLSVERIQ